MSGYNQLYIKESILGSGGNANVYNATRKVDNKKVALKILHNKTKDKVFRFEDEINIMSKYCNTIDGILPIHDFSIENCWYTMPIAETIKTHIELNDNIGDLIDGIIELCDTLIELHSMNIAHRDIKPDNIYYYKNRYYFGDFGLVDIPDNPKDLTKNTDRIGARFTIAPEMLRFPKTADGKKADVYSLAKTLWIILTGKEHGFEGQYNILDDNISLNSTDKLKEVHLVEIHELLLEATKNSPQERPSILEFKNKLIEWKTTYGDILKEQRSNWNFIIKYLFANNRPTTCIWTKIHEIVYVLNIISKLPVLNYMVFSDQGGMDFLKAEKANEEGCIYIYVRGMCYLVKPRSLILEVFNNSEWNYFLLELENQKPILDSSMGSVEYLVEDTKAHYVFAEYVQYGVYDYESGDRFPQGYKAVYRYINGKFLIVPKHGFYNSIISVTDGRHGDTSSFDFRLYMESIIRAADEKGGSREEIIRLLNKIFNQNPFKREEIEGKINSKIISQDFIDEHFEAYCFIDLINKIELREPSNIAYYFKFSKGYKLPFLSLLKSEGYFLCKDGYIRYLKEGDNNIFLIYNREEALNLYFELRDELKKLCFANDEDIIPACFNVDLIRLGKPNHLFSESEIKDLMKNADDRVNNTLVIDEEGNARIVQQLDEANFYPVKYETWVAGNLYVGKYSALGTADIAYRYCLNKWLEYLSTNCRANYLDFVDLSITEEELIKQIRDFY